MSAGAPRRWAEAAPIAGELVELLADACERIEIAGSIRRRRGEVHDIEIVAIPRIELDLGSSLWGDIVRVDQLGPRIAALIDEGLLALREVTIVRRDGRTEQQRRDGVAYKALSFRGMPVDLFLTDRERWGATLALRTGPGDWNVKLVTACQRYFRRVDACRVLHLGEVIPTPEEADFFRALGQPWVEPADRRPDRVRIDPGLLAGVGT